MSDGFGRIKRWDLNHFNDDAHAEEVHFLPNIRVGRIGVSDTVSAELCWPLYPPLNGLAGIITVNSFSNI